MEKTIISTPDAPKAIGPYSQAVKAGNTVYFSGQIALDPKTMTLVDDSFDAQTIQVFENLSAVAKQAGGALSDIVKLNIYLTNLQNFAALNEIMMRYFSAPYPARAAVGVKELPMGVDVEMEAVMVLPDNA